MNKSVKPYTYKKKQNSITILTMDISRVEWTPPFFLNLPPSLILLILKILKWYFFQTVTQEKLVKRDITWKNIFLFICMKISQYLILRVFWSILKKNPFLEKGKLNKNFKWYPFLFIYTRAIYPKCINIFFIDI